jgi:hypothetical protein
MKLITEFTHQGIECIVEAADKNGVKKFHIEGVFAQMEEKNRNGRVYPKSIMESAVNKYVKEQVSQGRAVGELNHPEGPTVNLDKVSHLITSLTFEKNDVIGKATILNTPMGQIVSGLLEGGVRLGVSTRGMGSLDRQNGQNVVGSDYVLNTIDIVQDPSAHGAFVNGIMEGVDWVWNNGLIERREIERIETEIKNAGRTYSKDVQIREFKNFLSNITLNV